LTEVKEASSSLLCPRDTFRREQLISRLRRIPPRNLLRAARSYAVDFIADYGWRLVRRLRISLNGHDAHIVVAK
jgi:hypothetical protein